MDQYREGTVKRTPVRGVKQHLKPYVYKQWEHYGAVGVTVRLRAFCITSQRVATRREVKPMEVEPQGNRV